MRPMLLVVTILGSITIVSGKIEKTEAGQKSNHTDNGTYPAPGIELDDFEEPAAPTPVPETTQSSTVRECDLDESCEEISSTFLQSALDGNVELFEEILSKGVDLETSDLLGNTCLHIASREGHLYIVNRLLLRGAEVDSRNAVGLTSLMEATVNDQTTIMERLLAFGADKEAKGGLYEQTPVSLAASHGAIESLSFLLDKGVVVDTEDYEGWTPLIYAARYGYSLAVIPLLDSGASTSKVDSINQQTPLMWAAEYGFLDCVKILVERGASLSIRSRNGMTAYGWAATKSHQHILKYLRSKGSTE